jgi:hypothetical protein
MLRVLQLRNGSPRAFAARAPDLIDLLVRAPAERRAAWSEALERVLQRHVPGGDDGLCFALGVAAMHFGDWGLAERASRRELRAVPRHIGRREDAAPPRRRALEKERA